LASLLDDAGDDLGKWRKGLEDWFDEK